MIARTGNKSKVHVEIKLPAPSRWSERDRVHFREDRSRKFRGMILLFSLPTSSWSFRLFVCLFDDLVLFDGSVRSSLLAASHCGGPSKKDQKFLKGR